MNVKAGEGLFFSVAVFCEVCNWKYIFAGDWSREPLEYLTKRENQWNIATKEASFMPRFRKKADAEKKALMAAGWK